jgi:glycosyltransferase involved in cell wall biosynthesis
MDAHANRIGGRQVEIIPNAVPTQEPVSNEIRARVRREIVGDPTRRIVITVGRFVQAKGYEDMIDAFVSIHRKHPEAVLVMVGSGILFPKIKMKVYDLQLTDSVYLLGERKDISRLLAAGDVYASSSNREGLPVAVLEAMMAGLPVVGTNVGDMAKVVTDEIGRIVPPHHPELLAEAIDELLNAPEKIPLMGKVARLRAMQEYSVELWMARHAALYKEILNSKGHLTPI